MNIIYLIRIRGTNLFKIGFSSNWDNRRKSYITDNPLIEFVECIKTRAHNKHKIERICQKEIEKIGGEFIINHNTKTEWFSFNKDFNFKMLSCCKNRKIYPLY